MKYKSRLFSLILTVLLGPLGLLYSSIAGGIILTVVAVVTAPTIFGPVGCWMLSIAWGDHAAHKHNKGIDRLMSAIRAR